MRREETRINFCVGSPETTEILEVSLKSNKSRSYLPARLACVLGDQYTVFLFKFQRRCD